MMLKKLLSVDLWFEAKYLYNNMKYHRQSFHCADATYMIADLSPVPRDTTDSNADQSRFSNDLTQIVSPFTLLLLRIIKQSLDGLVKVTRMSVVTDIQHLGPPIPPTLQHTPTPPTRVPT
jgi:hypothetical protein